jgi:hypothetical protein
VQSVLVDRPVDYAVRKTAGAGKQASLLVKFPVLIAWTLLAQTYVIDPVTDFAYDYRIQSQIDENRKTYDQLIHSDFRFDAVLKELEAKTIDQKEAERQAYMIGEAYQNYYQYRDGRSAKFSLADNMKLLDHYLFAHLRPVIEGEVDVPDDFRRLEGFHARLSDEEKQHLFQLTHGLYFEYQIIELYAQGKSAPPNLLPLLGELDQNDFTKRLKALRDSHRITADQFHRALQERAFWDYRLKCYHAMHLQRLIPGADQPARLADFEAEILTSLSPTDGAFGNPPAS